MKYVINSEREEIDFERYRGYLETIREKLPEHVYAFASNPCFYNLESPRSLHDAWLETLTVREAATGKRQEIRKLEIKLCLLGPFHDRRIFLNYFGVTRYSIDAPARYDEPRYEHTAHGDLIAHEIRLTEKGLLIHELLFERDATILIECTDFTHAEEVIPPIGP